MKNKISLTDFASVDGPYVFEPALLSLDSNRVPEGQGRDDVLILHVRFKQQLLRKPAGVDRRPRQNVAKLFRTWTCEAHLLLHVDHDSGTKAVLPTLLRQGDHLNVYAGQFFIVLIAVAIFYWSLPIQYFACS